MCSFSDTLGERVSLFGVSKKVIKNMLPNLEEENVTSYLEIPTEEQIIRRNESWH